MFFGIGCLYQDLQIITGAFLVVQMVKNPPGLQETQGQFLGWEDP